MATSSMEHDAAVTHVTGRKRVVLKNNGGKIKRKMLDNLKKVNGRDDRRSYW